MGSRLEARKYSFEKFGRELDENPATRETTANEVLILDEIKIGCTLGMLLCSDRPRRLAYILGDILELDHMEAAAALEITLIPQATQPCARAEMVAFLRAKCGLCDPENRRRTMQSTGSLCCRFRTHRSCTSAIRSR